MVVKNLANAKKNAVAHQSGDFTVADVLSSPLVASPIRKLDIAPDTDGAVAMILASEKRARQITKTPVWIKGIGTCYDAYYLGDRDLAGVFALEKAAAQAYRMAGIKNPRRQIDVAEVGDLQELLWMEARLVRSGRGRSDGESGATEIRKASVNLRQLWVACPSMCTA